MLTSVQLPTEFDFHCPVTLHAGNLALDHLPFDLSMVGANRPLLVVDAKHGGALERMKKQILGVFQATALQPVLLSVAPTLDYTVGAAQIVKRYQEVETDALVVIGAGALVDQVKLARGLLSLNETMDSTSIETLAQISARPEMALFWVATSAVNGREASGWIDEPGPLFCQALSPDVVVVDPRMMDTEPSCESLPHWLNGLVTAIEAVVFDPSNPFAHMYAHTAIAGIWPQLAPAAGNRLTRKARANLVTAAICAGWGLSSQAPQPVSVLGRAVATIGRIDPGIAGMLVLPYMIAQAGPPVSERLPVGLAAIAGADVAAVAAPDRQAAEVLRRLYDLPQALQAAGARQFPGTLKAAGLPRFLFDDVIEAALALAGHGQMDPIDLRAVLEAAWKGEYLSL